MAVTYANVFPTGQKDGVAYATSLSMPSTEGDLWNQGDTVSHPPLSGQVVAAQVHLAVTGLPLVNNTYVVLQTDCGGGVWMDVAWVPWTATTGTLETWLAGGVLLASSVQQTRTGMPNTSGSNAIPLGGRFRLIGASQLTGGVGAAVTATIKTRVIMAAGAGTSGSGGSTPNPPSHTSNTRLAPSGIRTRFSILGPTITPGSQLPSFDFVVPLGSPASQVGWDTFAPNVSGSGSGTMALSNITKIANFGDAFAAWGDGYSSDSKIKIYGQTSSGNAAFEYATNETGTPGNVYLNGDKLIAKIAGVPANSMYLAYPDTSGVKGTPLVINRADAWWVQGSSTSNNRVFAGDTVSIHGMNLGNLADPTKSWVWIVRGDGTGGTFVATTSVDPYRVQFAMPGTFTTGDTIRVYVHNGHGGIYGWSDYVTIYLTTAAIYAASYFAVNYAANNVNFDDYYTGNPCSTALAAAIAAVQVGGFLGRITINTARTYLLDVKANLQLIQLYNGSGGTVIFEPDTTFNSATGEFIYSSAGGASLRDLHIDTTPRGTFGGTVQTLSGFSDIQDCVINTSNITSTQAIEMSANTQQTSAGTTGIILKNNTITGAGVFLHDNFAYNAIVDGNTIHTTGRAGGAVIFDYLECISFTNNIIRDLIDVGYSSTSNDLTTGGKTFTTDTGLNYTNGMDLLITDYSGYVAIGTLTCTVTSYNSGTGSLVVSVSSNTGTGTGLTNWVITGPDVLRGSARMLLSQAGGNKIYAAGNTSVRLTSYNTGAAEQFFFEGSALTIESNVASATANTVVLSDAVDPIWVTRTATVIAGKGTGQVRIITDSTGFTLTLDRPWNVVPNGTGGSQSVVQVNRVPLWNVVYNNTQNTVFGGDANSVGTQWFNGSYECICDGNSTTNFPAMAKLWARGYSGMTATSFFNYVLNNTGVNCFDGIGEFEAVFEGLAEIAIGGNTWRNNSCPSIRHRAIFILINYDAADGTLLAGSVYDQNTFSNVAAVAITGLYGEQTGGTGTATASLILVGNVINGGNGGVVGGSKAEDFSFGPGFTTTPPSLTSQLINFSS